MSINKLSLDEIITLALQSRKGTLKVTAALGELLAADAMINLCSFVNFWERYSETERQHISDVDQRVFESVSRAWIEFDAGPDDVAASSKLVSVLVACAKDLRSLLDGVDFYDDEVVAPTR